MTKAQIEPSFTVLTIDVKYSTGSKEGFRVYCGNDQDRDMGETLLRTPDGASFDSSCKGAGDDNIVETEVFFHEATIDHTSRGSTVLVDAVYGSHHEFVPIPVPSSSTSTEPLDMKPRDVQSLDSPYATTTTTPTPDAIVPTITPSGWHVTYQVTGSASSVNVTYSTPSGTVQKSTLTLPVSLDAGTFGRSGFTYISAQNQGSTGDVTCAIEADGTQRSSNTSQGGYSIAQCDWSTPN